MSKPPVPTPSDDPGGTPPAGAAGTTAPCCPDVATFEKAPRRHSYFGFDETTNMVANVGADEYWIPSINYKTVPSDRETRDGARWVSVGRDQETVVEIHFGGNYQPSCIENCTFEFDPPNIAEVTGPAITRSGMLFRIKGKTVGEGSLKVMCEGLVRGYFHIWCAEPVTLSVDVSCLVTPDSTAVSYDAGDLQSFLNTVFRQALISFEVRDLGTLEIEPPISGYIDPIEANLPHYLAMDAEAMSMDWKWAADYRLYFYARKTRSTVREGIATGIGEHGAGFVNFGDNLDWVYHTLTHELGHLLGLSHPVYDFIDDKDEFPVHQFASLIPALNILVDDPENLMGYIGPGHTPGGGETTLRYLQWKKCRRS